jgi:hypothetical protein
MTDVDALDLSNPPACVAKPPSCAQASEHFVYRFQVAFDSAIAIGEKNSKYSH